MLANESFMLILMLRMKVPGNESCNERNFHRWNFRSREQNFSGTKVPVTDNTAFSVKFKAVMGLLLENV